MPTLQELLARPLVQASDFVLLGGWRLSSVGAGGTGLSFPQGMFGGTMLIEHGSGTIRYCTLMGHTPGYQGHKMSIDLAQADPDASHRTTTWPIASPVRLLDNFIHADCYTNTGSPSVHPDFDQMGICRPNGNHYLTSGRAFYATDSEPPYNRSQIGPFLTWSDADASGAYTSVAVPSGVNNMPAFGGGFLDVPPWFADAYLGGRNFGVGLGGYQSGQGSSAGPALFVCDRPTDGQTVLTNATTLIKAQWQGGVLSPDEMRASRAKRPPDYAHPEGDYTFGPQPLNGVGYWAADHIGGNFWVDTPTKQGFCCLFFRGVGTLDYLAQIATFCTDRRLTLNVWAPQTLAQVAQGQLIPTEACAASHSTEPFVHPWFGNATSNTSTGANSGYWPQCVGYDPIDNLVYVALQDSNNNLGGALASVIVVYSITEGTVPPVGQTRHLSPNSMNIMGWN